LEAEVAEVVELLAADLVGYQDEAYAERFLADVEAALAAERQAVGGSTELTETVARSLHKLLAYKDEYEVARLMLLPEATATVESVGGRGRNATWHLHPPMLKALGLDRKVPIGAWAKPAFRALRAGKRFRGSRLDPFGRSEMRRTERAIVGEFTDALAVVYRGLSADSFDAAVAIAALPDAVRGYEELKLRRVGEFRRELAEHLARYT